MISTSYDLDESQRNSSNSLNDEESIFLSSSSDEDVPLSSRFASVGCKASKNKYMETMINDGLGEEEEEEEEEASLISAEEDEESDEAVQYIPGSSAYTQDHIEDVSDEDESKPTKMYDEYDPENIDEFNEAALKRQSQKVVEYEPTKLNKSAPPEKVDQPKKRQTRSARTPVVAEPKPETRPKRKYTRKPVEEAERLPEAAVAARDSNFPTVVAAVVAKRPYNNANRIKNAENKRQVADKQETKKPKLVKAESDEMVVSPSAGSPVSSSSSLGSDDGKENDKASEQNETTAKAVQPKKAEAAEEKKKSSKPLFEAKADSSKTDDKSTVISGRIINLSSGFKIPKRPSSETDQGSVPPEKKVKTSAYNSIDEASKKTTVAPVKPVKSPTEQTANKDKMTKPSIGSAAKPIKPMPTKTESKVSSMSESKSKPKPQKTKEERVVTESDLFMEALGTSRPAARPKHKISKTLNGTKSEAKPIAETEGKSASTQNTNISNQPQNKNLDKLSNNNFKETVACTDSVQSRLAQINKIEKESNELNSDSSKTAGGNPAEPGPTKKEGKKRVVWADACQKQLESIEYFYLDEIEREIKKNAFKGGDMAKIEKLNEKELKFKHHDDFSFDNVQLTEVEWPALIPIDLPDYIVQPVICSAEHEVQLKREKDILEVLMFKQFLPDSPSEPTDLTPVTISTKLIPLEDVNLSSDFDTSNNGEQSVLSEPPQSNDMYSNHHNQKNKSLLFKSATVSPSTPTTTTATTTSTGKNITDYYNKQYYSQDKDARIAAPKSSSPPQTRPAIQSMFAPASPPRSDKPNSFLNLPAKLTMTQDTPLSPPVTVNNPTRFNKPIESPLAAEPPKKEEPAAILNNLANNLLSSDEMTEKIKQILSQINMTKPLTSEAAAPQEPKLKSITDIDFNPPKVQTNFNTFNNNNNNEYKKNSKWNSNNNYNNSNNVNNNNNNNKFQNNYKNNNNDVRPVNNNNNRNTFQSNFRRGIGNRSEGSNHNNFNGRNNNFNNNDNGYNSKFNNNRGGSVTHNSNNNNNFNNHRKEFNNNRFDQNKQKESRFDNNGANAGTNGQSKYENDLLAKPKETPAPAANVGRWI